MTKYQSACFPSFPFLSQNSSLFVLYPHSAWSQMEAMPENAYPSKESFTPNLPPFVQLELFVSRKKKKE